MQTKTLSELIGIAASDAPEDDMAIAEIARRVQHLLNSAEINLIPGRADELVETWVNGTRYVEDQIPEIDQDNPLTVKAAMILENILNRGLTQGLIIELMKGES